MIKTRQRNFNLDSLRGIMLVIITINHTNGPFHHYTYQSFGFISAAEGFIFLSGIMLGLINGKRLLTYDVQFVKSNIFRRSLIIYIYHLITALLITAPLLFYNISQTKWNVNVELLTFLKHPLEAFFSYSLLLYQPPFLDILPMYVLFIFVGYFALVGFYKNRTKTVLISSFILWFLSQFNWLNIFDITIGNYPFLRPGSFNPFSWQLLFTIGCYLGYCSATGKTLISSTEKFAYIALIIAVSFFIVRHSSYFITGHSFSDLKLLITELIADNAVRFNLGIFRLFNFAAVAYLVYFAINSGLSLRSPWLETLGQHSLQVFTFHVILIYYISPFRETIFALGTYYELFFQFVFVATLIIPAWLHRFLQKSVPAIKASGV